MKKITGFNNNDHNQLKKGEKYGYVFTIVRDPVERFLSAFWHHMTLDSPKHYWRTTDAERSRIRHLFSDPNEFITAIENPDNSKHNVALEEFSYHTHFVAQTSFLIDDKGNIDPRINDIFVYSKNLSKQLGIPISSINKTPRHPDIQLTEKSLAFIKRIYQKDYELLGL